MLHATHSANKKIPWPQLLLPWQIAAHLRERGELIVQLTKRDVLGRYRGSFLGIFWSLLRPLFMLAVYTVVFGYIFQSKLGNRPDESKMDFTLALFCGLVLFDFFAEAWRRPPPRLFPTPTSPTRFFSPLKTLSVPAIGAALTHLLISLA